jgi:hypothetical protein
MVIPEARWMIDKYQTQQQLSFKLARDQCSVISTAHDVSPLWSSTHFSNLLTLPASHVPPPKWATLQCASGGVADRAFGHCSIHVAGVSGNQPA